MNVFVDVDKFKAILSLQWVATVCSETPGDEVLTLFLKHVSDVRFI